MGSGEEYLPSGHTFVIADDHPLFRGALKEALAGIGDVAAIHEAGDFEGAKALVLANEDIDMVLLDLSMPGASGLSGLISLRGIHSSVPLVVVSAHDDPVTIRRARFTRAHPPFAIAIPSVELIRFAGGESADVESQSSQLLA